MALSRSRTAQLTGLMPGMAMHAITNGMNASSAATLWTKCHAPAAQRVLMPDAALATQATAVRESYDAALQTFHGAIRHKESEQNCADHCATMTARGQKHHQRGNT
jgi:hypothetical protein